MSRRNEFRQKRVKVIAANLKDLAGTRERPAEDEQSEITPGLVVSDITRPRGPIGWDDRYICSGDRCSELAPFAPMGRTYREPPVRVGMQPAARNFAAGEDDHMVFAAIEDGELKIAVKRRGRYRLPHEA